VRTTPRLEIERLLPEERGLVFRPIAMNRGAAMQRLSMFYEFLKGYYYYNVCCFNNSGKS
jgi:hypothetical protein